jgi:hypothetical protein
VCFLGVLDDHYYIVDSALELLVAEAVEAALNVCIIVVSLTG